jgi:hypothetical protein
MLSNMSFNFRIFTGFYPNLVYISNLNIRLNLETICVDSVGFLSSTPILYLISPLGDINVHKGMTTNNCDSHSVLMRIQNSFTFQIPLIATNSDFKRRRFMSEISQILKLDFSMLIYMKYIYYHLCG